MKILGIVWICSVGLALGLLAQSPTLPPQPPATVSPGSPALASPAGSVSPTASPASELERSIAKKHKKHFNFTIGDGDSDTEAKGDGSHDDIPALVVPIVAALVGSMPRTKARQVTVTLATWNRTSARFVASLSPTHSIRIAPTTRIAVRRKTLSRLGRCSLTPVLTSAKCGSRRLTQKRSGNICWIC